MWPIAVQAAAVREHEGRRAREINDVQVVVELLQEVLRMVEGPLSDTDEEGSPTRRGFDTDPTHLLAVPLRGRVRFRNFRAWEPLVQCEDDVAHGRRGHLVPCGVRTSRVKERVSLPSVARTRQMTRAPTT